MQTIRADPIWQVVKSIMGLARIERAKPLFVQTLDVVGAFATATVSPFPHLIRGASTSAIWVVQICCAPGPT